MKCPIPRRARQVMSDFVSEVLFEVGRREREREREREYESSPRGESENFRRKPCPKNYPDFWYIIATNLYPVSFSYLAPSGRRW